MTEPRPRGRPKDLDKRAAILREARQLFLDHGLEAVKVDQIAQAADVSKMTVYANFPDKAAVFEAVVAQESAEIDAALANIQICSGSIDVILTGVGTTLLTFLLSPEVMRLDHLLGSEMNSHPGLGRRFYQVGPNRMWQTLTEILKASHHRREIRVDDARQAAEDLIALWLGMVPLQHRFNGLPAVSQNQILARVRHGVTIFMKAYRL